MFIPIWIVVLAGVIIVILSICLFHASAPDGFEDEEGFHTYQDAYEHAKEFSSNLAGKLYDRLTEIETLNDTINELNRLNLENVEKINDFANRDKIQLGIENLSPQSLASEKLDKVIIEPENLLKEGMK